MALHVMWNYDAVALIQALFCNFPGLDVYCFTSEEMLDSATSEFSNVLRIVIDLCRETGW